MQVREALDTLKQSMERAGFPVDQMEEPAGSVDIDRLEDAIGPVPDELKELLRIHNGDWHWPDVELLSAGQIVAETFAWRDVWKMNEEPDLGLIPFTSDGAGNSMMLRPDGGVLFYDHELEPDEQRHMFNSLTDYLLDLAAKIENGERTWPH